MLSHVTVALDTLIMRVIVILFIFSIVSITADHTSPSGPRRGKIIGGNEARPRTHPYLVSLQMRFLWTSLRICTGSLLSEKWILTAGHCLKGNWLTNWLPMEALVGTNDLVEKASTVQTVRIADRQLHPKYRGRLGAYDIGMLKTAKNIQFNSAVYPIALPFSIEHYRPNVKNLILAGWGDLETTLFTPAFHNKLQEATVMNMPFEECMKVIQGIISAIEDFETSPMDIASNICSGGTLRGGVAACSGDSGAPLIQYVALDEQESTSSASEELLKESGSESNNNERNTNANKIIDENTTTESNPFENELTVADLIQQYIDQGLTPVSIGVVSWGPCGLVGAPTVYNNVSTYTDFIQQHLYT